MKIAVVYIPRVKSTMTHDVLAKHFSLDPWKEPLTISRRSNQSYDEYPELIRRINTTDNIIVKICVNDFIDTKNCKILDAYKSIDYSSFDHIVFIKRADVMGTIASFGHHNLFDPTKWHRKKGEDFKGRTYQIEMTRVFYILRAYRMFGDIQNWVANNAGLARLYDYDFQTVEEHLKNDFALSESDFDIDIVPMGLDYKNLATNYQEVANSIDELYNTIMSVPLNDVNNPKSVFWRENVNFI